jgi:hypothetical protein
LRERAPVPSLAVSSRAFVVRVIEPAARIVVEDVRTGASTVVTDLEAVRPQIEQWLREDQRAPLPVPSP